MSFKKYATVGFSIMQSVCLGIAAIALSVTFALVLVALICTRSGHTPYDVPFVGMIFEHVGIYRPDSKALDDRSQHSLVYQGVKMTELDMPDALFSSIYHDHSVGVRFTIEGRGVIFDNRSDRTAEDEDLSKVYVCPSDEKYSTLMLFSYKILKASKDKQHFLVALPRPFNRNWGGQETRVFYVTRATMLNTIDAYNNTKRVFEKRLKNGSYNPENDSSYIIRKDIEKMQ